MFMIVGQHSFEPDLGMCWLSTSCGYSDDFSWDMNLQSRDVLTHFQSESVPASFGIHARPVLGVRNWRDLPGQEIEVLPEALRCGFMFSFDMSRQWENLIDLHLRFGQVLGTQIEVFAEGRGCVEAAPDVFPEGEVGFQIQTWATFRGIGVNVPLNAGDPLGYSVAKIKALLPRYCCSPPILKRTNDDSGTLCAVEVLFSPDESL